MGGKRSAGKERHMTTNHKLIVENIRLMKALEKAREYIESDARNKKYPSAIETLAIIDAAFSWPGKRRMRML
jgi:hypothetical protein